MNAPTQYPTGVNPGWFNIVQWSEVPRDPAAKAVLDARGDPLPYATHHGVLQFGDVTLRCYQLNTGQAVIHTEDIERLLAGITS